MFLGSPEGSWCDYEAKIGSRMVPGGPKTPSENHKTAFDQICEDLC